MLYLVTGTVQRKYYGSDSKEFKQTRLVEAETEANACVKFSKHFEDQTSEYAVYYQTWGVEAFEVIK